MKKMPATTVLMKHPETSIHYNIQPLKDFPSIEVEFQNNLIQSIKFAPLRPADTNNGFDDSSPILDKLNQWFLSYQGASPEPISELPLNWEQGSVFQQQVWKILCNTVPFGKTMSYGELSIAVTGNTASSRAIGMAMNRNPWMILVPCHRVIGINGALTGYAGGLTVKEQLIQFEQNLLVDL